MSYLRRNCREVTALILAGEDRSLGLIERWVVRAHARVCKGCGPFSRQVALMRQALPRWRAYRDGAP